MWIIPKRTRLKSIVANLAKSSLWILSRKTINSYGKNPKLYCCVPYCLSRCAWSPPPARRACGRRASGSGSRGKSTSRRSSHRSKGRSRKKLNHDCHLFNVRLTKRTEEKIVWKLFNGNQNYIHYLIKKLNQKRKINKLYI